MVGTIDSRCWVIHPRSPFNRRRNRKTRLANRRQQVGVVRVNNAVVIHVGCDNPSLLKHAHQGFHRDRRSSKLSNRSILNIDAVTVNIHHHFVFGVPDERPRNILRLSNIARINARCSKRSVQLISGSRPIPLENLDTTYQGVRSDPPSQLESGA